MSMSALGEDFAGGLFRRLYWPVNPAGLVVALAGAWASSCCTRCCRSCFRSSCCYGFFGGDTSDTRDLVKASLVVIFPASLVVAARRLVAGGAQRRRARARC